MNTANPNVDFFFNKAQQWQSAYRLLRGIVLDCDLTEALKWGKPCYTHEGNNIVLIHGFKDYCALLFFKGALMKDSKGLLIQQTANVQSARQLRFTNASDISKLKTTVKSYIKEAIKLEQAGLKVVFKQTSEFVVAEEFQLKLKQAPALKKAFDALTPGRQRGYLLYFASAKQAKTRVERIEKCTPKIISGKGLDDPI